MGITLRGTAHGRSIASEDISSIGDSTPVTLTVTPGSVGALISVTGAEPIKWRVDGGNPTTVSGHPLESGGHLEVFREDMKAIKIICATAAQTTRVFVTYFEEF